MRPLWTRIAVGLGAVIGGLVVLLLALLLFANTDPGRNAVTALLNPLLGGNVSIAGLSGRFPDAPTAAHVEISDDTGVWLKLDNVSAKWSPIQLLHNRIVVHSISAERALILRRPVSGKSEGKTPRIDAKFVDIGRLTISPALASRAAVVSLSGSLHYVSRSEFSGRAHVTRLDGIGDYRATVELRNHDIRGSAALHEPAGGLLQEILHLPGLGALAVTATASGPAEANEVRVSASAGPLRAHVDGTVDLAHRAAALNFAADAPSMAPRADVSWQSLALSGSLHGAFAAPDVLAHVSIVKPAAFGASGESIAGDANGTHGKIAFKGSIAALRLPGSHPDLLASAPVSLEAHVDLQADTADISLAHPLVAANAHVVKKEDATEAVVAVKLNNLARFAELGGIKAAGSAEASGVFTDRPDASTISFDGTLRLADDASMDSKLLGRAARFAGLVTLKNGGVAIDRASVDGAAISASASGKWNPKALNATFALGLKDLSRLENTLQGRVVLNGTVSGSMRALAASASGTGTIATKGFASGPLRLMLRAEGLPDAPSGRLDVAATLDKSPLTLSAALSRAPKGAWRFVLNKAGWRNVRAGGEIVASNPSVPSGRIDLHAGSLRDLAPLLGTEIAGRLDGFATFAPVSGKPRAQITLAASDLALEDTRIRTLKIGGSIADPLGKPLAALAYSADGVSAGDVNGALSGTANGSMDDLAVVLASTLHAGSGPAVALSAAATLNAGKSQAALSKLDLHSGGMSAHLAAPAHVDLAHGIAVDSFRLAGNGAAFEAKGRLTPRLDASAALHDATGALLKPFEPGASVSGSLSASAKLAGTLDAPQGTMTLNGKGLRFGVDGAGAMPPADLAATATLHGTRASLDAHLQSGTRVAFTLDGDVPLKSAGAVSLHAAGTTELAVFDPILTAQGRSLHGTLSLNADIAGTFAQPRIAGSGRLTKGEFQDYVRGIRIHAMSAGIEAHGRAIAIKDFTAQAGEGTVTGNGAIDLAAPGEPVTLLFTATNARPIANDVVNAAMDANLKLAGSLGKGMTLSGSIGIRRGDIDIPDTLPPDVAVLNIRGKGRPPPPPPPIPLALDLTVTSPGQLYVRGHGLDAEMRGRVHIAGTTDVPDMSGGFTLRRGNLSLAGQTLDFSSGRVSFDSGSLRARIDPALDFTAQTTAGGTTAVLNVSGHASQPKVTLSSTPQLPQDEILSRLLFQQGMTQLSPWQMAQLGQALASFGGMGGLGDPLTRVRKSLGLDRLAVTTAGSNGTQTAVEAGRYVARNVYVGAKQGISGSGTQAVVQVDLTKHLKLQTQISSNNTPTPVTPGTVPVDTGSNLGISYQFEY